MVVRSGSIIEKSKTCWKNLQKFYKLSCSYLHHPLVLLPLWTKIEIFSQIFKAASPAPALSYNNGGSAAASTPPGCIPGINVRGDMASSLLCRGYKRRSRWDTRSGPFLTALGWLFIFISKLSASVDMTCLEERRLCRAARSLHPHPPTHSSICTLWDAPSSEQCLTDERFLNFSCAPSWEKISGGSDSKSVFLTHIIKLLCSVFKVKCVHHCAMWTREKEGETLGFCLFLCLLGYQLLPRTGGSRRDHSRAEGAHDGAAHLSPGARSRGKIPHQVSSLRSLGD